MPEDQTSPKRPRWVRLIVIFLIAVVLPCALFVAASVLTNMIRIPQEQQQTPKYLAVDAAASATPTTSTLSTDKPFAVALRAKSDDRSTSGHTPYALFLEAELRERPDLKGARQYVEFDRIYYGNPQRNPMRDFYFNSNEKKALWEAGAPVRGEADEWLRMHADLVVKFLDMAEGPGLPIRPMKLIRQIEDPDTVPLMGFFMRIGTAILAGEGQRLYQIGDIAGADRYWRASIRLSVMYGLEPDYSGMYSVLIPIACLKNRINSEIDRDTLIQYRTTLANAHRLLFPADGHREYLAWLIAARRRALVNILNQSWDHPELGWEASDLTRYAKYHTVIAGLELPRLDRMAVNAVFAMRVKQQGSQILRDFDAAYGEIVRRASATWPEIAASEPFHWPEPPWPISETFYDNRFFQRENVLPDIGYSSFERRKYVRHRYYGPEAWTRRAEANLNLMRAAIECRLTTETQIQKIVPKEIADRESPWRDPFTEKPLRVVEVSSSTLRVYSLGGDMIDQRGNIVYNPEKGITSPGDLFVDIKW